ncbi:flagellar assembly peptidoglycan hydrolase FlgJ [Chitinilyticum litopenaei]|uniref:flagellar assembly peptidoglycan hydrolase FlgJ n=1 Tax=Chitinilyticum litopenaei TaxID=1121276 RepID=UPI0004261F55|nr:flagellar assembly peptidoglycan hydrolase FlgJ [Chitinilyticum litopenaei]
MQTAATANQLAIDPHALRGLHSELRKDGSKAAGKVAEQFAALLLQQMLSSMREASPRFSEESNTGSQDLFRSMGDQQLAQTWSSQQGLGDSLAAMIRRQIERQQNPESLNQARAVRPDPLRVGTSPLPMSAAGAAKAAVTANSSASAGASASGFVQGTQDFILKVRDAAAGAAKKLGVSAELLVGHAALESGWGKRSIKDSQGNETWNLFGIKAGSGWTGKTADVLTTEYVNGVPQKRVERFRAYDSLQDAFADYQSLLERRYKGVIGAGNDARQFASALAAGGYATAPDYASKVVAVAGSVQQRLAAQSRTLG